jgi:hypothetical protein
MLFLYESLGKLVSVYPARWAARRRRINFALHGAVAFGVLVQALTVLVPGLRSFLGLEAIDARLILVLAVAVFATWAAAALARSGWRPAAPPVAGTPGMVHDRCLSHARR